MAYSTSTWAQAAVLPTDVWGAVGTELTIFCVTVAVALAMRLFTGQSRPVGKQGARKLVGAADAPKIAAPIESPADRCQAALAARARQRRHPAFLQASSLEGARPAQTAARQYPGQAPAARAPSQIIDEVVDGVVENKSMKFATRALTLFGKLQAELAVPGAPSMAKAAGDSKHTALDFYTTVLQCSVRVGRFDLLETIMDDMEHRSVARSLVFYEIAMKQLAAQKQYSAALSMYDRLARDGLQPSFITYSCLIGFAAEVGEFERAASFFGKLSSITTPSIRAYMTMLRVHAKRSDWSASLALFRDMRRRGVKPDSLVLNFVLATGIAADKVEAATSLVEEVDGEAQPISDSVSYNTLIKGYAQRGDVGGTRLIMDRMRGRGLKPNSITFNTAMDAAVRGGKSGEAWKALAAMRSAGLRPDKFTCSILVKGLAKGALPEQIQSALDLLGEAGRSCDATLLSTLYNGILEAAAAGRHTELATKVFTQMRRHHAQPSAAAQQLLAQVLPVSEAKRDAEELAQLAS